MLPARIAASNSDLLSGERCTYTSHALGMLCSAICEIKFSSANLLKLASSKFAMKNANILSFSTAYGGVAPADCDDSCHNICDRRPHASPASMCPIRSGLSWFIACCIKPSRIVVSWELRADSSKSLNRAGLYRLFSARCIRSCLDTSGNSLGYFSRIFSRRTWCTSGLLLREARAIRVLVLF